MSVCDSRDHYAHLRNKHMSSVCDTCHGVHGPQDMCPRSSGLDRPRPKEHLTPCTPDPNVPPSAIANLLAERETTHGSFAQNARHGQALRELFRAAPGWARATLREREALDYIAGKLSRILSGMPDPQHWEDIAGYATLAAHLDLQR